MAAGLMSAPFISTWAHVFVCRCVDRKWFSARLLMTIFSFIFFFMYTTSNPSIADPHWPGPRHVSQITQGHWGWVMLICVNGRGHYGSGSCILPAQHQAIIWTSADLLSITYLGTEQPKFHRSTHMKSLSKPWQTSRIGSFINSHILAQEEH